MVLARCSDLHDQTIAVNVHNQERLIDAAPEYRALRGNMSRPPSGESAVTPMFRIKSKHSLVLSALQRGPSSTRITRESYRTSQSMAGRDTLGAQR